MSRSAVSNASAVRLTSMTKKQVSREQSINAIRLERANCALGLATQAIAQIADVCGRAFPRRRFPKMRIATAAAWGAMLKANDLLVSAARDIVNGNVSVDTWDKMRAAVDEDATVGFLSWWTDEENHPLTDRRTS